MAERNVYREELAWAGGLFDGEGCISWSRSGRNGNSAVIQMSLAMTDQDPVERFHRAVGIGKVYYRHTPSDKAKGHKPQWVWSAHGLEPSQAVVAMLWPWLNKRRKAKAKEALAATRYTQHKRDRAHCPKGHLYSGENLMLHKNTVDGRTYVNRRCRICRHEQYRKASATYRAKKEKV